MGRRSRSIHRKGSDDVGCFIAHDTMTEKNQAEKDLDEETSMRAILPFYRFLACHWPLQ
jgi:hypothetical protein